MAAFEIKETPLKGALVIEAFHASDNRGSFVKYFEKDIFRSLGIDFDLNETFVSISAKNVIRGMHFQLHAPQAKLVSVPQGKIYDVIIDLVKNSKTYGKWYGVELTEENKKQFLIPKGFAHGFLVLSDIAEFCYKCDDFWHPNDEGGLAWNDPAIGIVWPELTGTYNGTASAEGYALADGTALNLSEKDQKWDTLEKTFTF